MKLPWLRRSIAELSPQFNQASSEYVQTQSPRGQEAKPDKAGGWSQNRDQHPKEKPLNQELSWDTALLATPTCLGLVAG